MQRKPHTIPESGRPKSGSAPTSWGGVAEWYDELLETGGDSFQSRVVMPNLLRILDPKPGMSVIDIACGQGYFSRAFAAAGATVSACDVSAELIAIAKEKGGSIDYRVAPADSLDFARDGAFDAATVILAMQNIDGFAAAIAEASRVLATGGRLILVLNHPAFRIPRRSSWGWDADAAAQYRRVDAYMSDARVKIDMTPGENDPNKKRLTVSFHRPLQSYVKALAKSGLAVARLEEWISHKKSQPGPRAAEEDRMRAEIPMFLMLEAVKR